MKKEKQAASAVKTAVLVSGGGTNLQAILDRKKAGELPHVEIALVLSSQKNAYALQRAFNAGIPAFSFSKKKLGGQEAFEKALLEKLDEYGIELIVLAGFLSILSEDFTKRYPERIINVHPALIPSFCGEGYYGLKVHEEALKRGVKVTGATVHFVNEIPDGGKIIAQRAVRVYQSDTPEILQRRVMRQAEWKILPAAVEEVAKGILALKNKEA
ncbi:MAG: phosphoribosylglycinamide formyltransferase [Lachnospiraceae bacterium]|nr:phosphoribosylglycinamide formyltransferase [Lachnospiraceae bacterium]